MGKKPAAAPKQAASPAAPGDRPPRPSHGHKWDEEKQQWVGKGSLDERKAAKLKDNGPKELADGTVLKSWQKLPSTVLAEWAQREKRPKPMYYNARSWDRSKWHQKVVLPDPKDKDKSLEFSPYDDSDTQSSAKEHAALVALLKVASSMPLERTLPEPYCDIWKSSAAETKTDAKSKAKAKAKAEAKAQTKSTPGQGSAEEAADAADAGTSFAPPLRAASQYSSRAEREAAERKRVEERNKREAIRDMKRRANLPAPILLSRKMRSQLYDVLGLQDAYAAAGSFADVEMDDIEAAAVARCVEWGFGANDVMRAVAAAQEAQPSAGAGGVEGLAERLRQWLCLHLPEDELPEQFAAGRGQLTVHTAESAEEARSRAKAKAAEDAAKKSPPVSEFEAARASLAAWLKDELIARLGASDADALHASAEAILLGIEPSADDEEAAEVGENVAIVLASESEELEAVGNDFKDKWAAVWATRSSSAAAGDADMKAGEDDIDDDDLATTAGGDAPSDVATAIGDDDGFWESGVVKPDAPSFPSAGNHGRSKNSPVRSMWFGSAAGTPEVVAAESAWPKTAAGQRMAKHRQNLPAAKAKDELMQLCRGNAVVLVQGETGCGKTTQVGQFLLETDPSARVVVTQPRRVAATSVAQRVAEERGERLGEGAVGYMVRGESKLRRDRGRLLFCTNGVLLRRLLGEPETMFSHDTCTHLVIDEVHERSVEIDLILTLLHHVLPQRPKLRVILMSATMDVAQLASLFDGKPPTIKIPGRTFPVSQLFLDDLSEWQGGKGADNAHGGHLPQLDFRAIAETALAALRGQLRDAPEDGAVLIFVPGVGEIDRVSREISHRAEKGEAYVLPLHGGLPSEQQRRCFEIPPKGGARKIVVSTNVAETSVTVPDVTVVIDTARERRLQLEPGAVAACLAETTCARSSLTQRKGRAGRVREGLCVTMLSRSKYDKLPAEAPPEIESVALESLCLQVRVSGFEPAPFLARMPTPPRVQRVDTAEKMLAKIGATRVNDTGTEVAALGRHLAALPCDVHTGKLLIVGAFLGVASMAVDVAAMLSVRSPLKSVARDPKAESWREQLRQSLRPGGTKSDHCLYAKLLQMWVEANGAGRRELCQNAAVVWERMSEAASIRSQLMSALRGLGFDVRRGDDRSSGEWRALRVAVTAAFYPQLAKVVRPPPEFTDGISGAVEKKAEARKLRYFVQTDPFANNAGGGSDGHTRGYDSWWGSEQRAFLHPASLLFKETSYSCPWVVFSSKQMQEAKGDYSSRLNLSNAAEASIYALLLFGGRLDVDHRTNQVTIDGWITFSGGSTTVVALVDRLRIEIDKLLLQKVAEPWLRLGDSPICQAVSNLLSTDGLG